MNVTEIGIYNKLAAASGLTTLLTATTAIYPHAAPQGTSMAYVVFGYSAGGLMNINPSELHNTVYFVKGVAASSAAATAIQTQLKAALHLQTLTVTGYTNIQMLCENEINYTETTREGTLVYHAGWYFRVKLDD
jgi:hypothetical protein